MDILLGLDLGTTNCKALAIDQDGKPVASASFPTPSRIVPVESNAADNSRAEYEASQLWRICADLIRKVIRQLGAGRRITAVAVSSMGGGAHNAFWQQVKTDVLGLAVDTPAVTNVSALVAALLAGIGVGAFPSEIEAVSSNNQSAMRFESHLERTRFMMPSILSSSVNW